MGPDKGKERRKVPVLFMLGAVLVLVQLSILPLYIRTIGREGVSNPLDTVGGERSIAGVSAQDPLTPGTRKTTLKRTDKPAGLFNNYPIYYKDGKDNPIHSSVHCVGENYNKMAWIRRSCKFRHFCFDTLAQDFVIYQSKEEQELQASMSHRQFHDASNTMNVTVAVGGINTKWTWKSGVPRMEWFPKVIPGELSEPYYELDPSVVWIPVHSLAGFNPGHLIWDDFLPIYTLMRMFQLFEGRQLMMMRYILKGPRMWATCDLNDANSEMCTKMYNKFLPLMGLSSHNFSTSEDFVLKLKKPKSNLICASHGAAGIGLLTDHGTKLHGWEKDDFDTTHNHGRGAMLFEFRNFMVSNVGLPLGPLSPTGPYKITFSVGSSKATTRDFDFKKQMAAIKDAFGDLVVVRIFDLKKYSATEQVQLAAESAIFVTACGGGAVTATFLPLGASVILYYAENGGVRNNRLTGLPALLDWDLFNNAAYLRAHWLPSTTMDTKDDLDILIKLIRHDLDLISHQEY